MPSLPSAIPTRVSATGLWGWVRGGYGRRGGGSMVVVKAMEGRYHGMPLQSQSLERQAQHL